MISFFFVFLFISKNFVYLFFFAYFKKEKNGKILFSDENLKLKRLTDAVRAFDILAIVFEQQIQKVFFCTLITSLTNFNWLLKIDEKKRMKKIIILFTVSFILELFFDCNLKLFSNNLKKFFLFCNINWELT